MCLRNNNDNYDDKDDDGDDKIKNNNKNENKKIARSGIVASIFNLFFPFH